MAPKGRRGFEIDIDPDLVKASQSQGQRLKPKQPKQRSGASTPAPQSTSQVGSGTPSRSSNASTPRHQSGSLSRRSGSALGIEIDPDLLSSASQAVRTTPGQPLRASTPGQRPGSVSRPSVTPAPQAGRDTLSRPPPATASRPPGSSVAQAGRYLTPSVRNRGSRFSTSSFRSHPTPRNYLEIDDIDDSSPESKNERSTATPVSRGVQVSRAANVTSRHGSRALSPKRRLESPSLIGLRPPRATDAMDIDDDSIHSSSPPECIPDSIGGDSPEEEPEVLVKQEVADSMDEDSPEERPEREIPDSADEESPDEAEDRNVRSVTESTHILRLNPKEAEVKNAKPAGRSQFLKPPKFTFKSDKPPDRPQFLAPPQFTFTAPRGSPSSRPNPKKYIFKEDIRLPSPSPPAPEPEPEPAKKKKAKPLLKNPVPGGLADTLRRKMTMVNNTLPDRLVAAGVGRTILEVDVVQQGGNKKNRFWLVRGRLETSGRVVCLMLPGNGRRAYPSGEFNPEVQYNPVTSGCTVGVKGPRWITELEGVKWTVAPDWFVVKEKQPEVRKNVVYGPGWVAYDIS